MTDRVKPPCAVTTDPEQIRALKKALAETIEELRRRQGYPLTAPRPAASVH